MKANKQASVTVLVIVEGVEAMRGNASVPGYKRGSVPAEVIQGTLRSAALRCVSAGMLRNEEEVVTRLDTIFRVNAEEAEVLERELEEASGEAPALEG